MRQLWKYRGDGDSSGKKANEGAQLWDRLLYRFFMW